MGDWFATRELERGVWLVAEPCHVNSFLVAGLDRAALIDSGLGIADVRPVVASLTDLDVVVVNTHHHWDHVGGNAGFTEVAIHEAGLEPLRRPVDAEKLAAYAAYARDRLGRLEGFAALDERYFSFLADETTPRPLPPAFDPSAWRIEPGEPTRLLAEGDAIDLGGRALRVLHTPGHTPDSICLLEEREGWLFAGDTINTGPIYAHMPDSDLETFAASTARLASMGDAVRRVYMAHFTRYVENTAFLREVAEGFAAAAAGEVEWRPNEDEEGIRVREATFARFSIFAPAR